MSITSYLRFPVQNEVTGSIVWFVVRPTSYGCETVVCKDEPTDEQVQNYAWLESAMACVHVDYFVDYNRMESDDAAPEVVQVQLFDELNGPYGDSHWTVPELRDQYADASIVLVEDVQAWQPPEDA